MRDMTYKFNYQTSAFELWQLSMYGTYGSMIGVCNIIFTAAMLLLAAKIWGDINSFIKILLIVGISLFTVIQPLAVYIRAKRQIATVPQDMEIGFDDNGIHVKTSNKYSDLKWSTVKGVTKKSSMIIIFTTAKHGFIISNKMLEKQKDDFYDYVVSKI